MNIEIDSLYQIVGIFFFLLPVGVYLATIESHDRQVYWWCLGGMGNCIGFMLVGLRGDVPDFFSFFIAHVFFTLGFCFRSLALRLETSTHLPRTIRIYCVIGSLYLIIFSMMVYFEADEVYRLIWVLGFRFLMALDVLNISQLIYKKLQNKGGKLIAWMAVFILAALAVRILGMMTDLEGDNVFDRGSDHYIALFLIILGYVLGNFGFIHLRMEKIIQNKKIVDLKLVDTQNKNKTLEETLEERNDLMRKLSLSAKANSMGTMLGAIAHEINQPLGAIRLNTEMLIALNRRAGDLENFNTSLQHILQDNERAAIVVSSLRSFFINGSNAFVPMNMSQLVNDAYRILMPEARLRGVNLWADVQPDLWINGDQNQLQMVVLNLINNAMDAVTLLSSEKNIYVRVSQGDQQILLEVSDNGPGVPDHKEASIFELFNTTKEKGMGMGLWLSRAIMDAHEGSIKHLKGPANETLFRVSIPSCLAPAVQVEP